MKDIIQITRKPRRLVKQKILDEKTVKKLFDTNQVKTITYLDRAEEIKHIYEANQATKNRHYKECTVHNFKRLTENRQCRLVITDKLVIARNKHDDNLVIPLEWVEKYNTKELPIEIEKVPLTYNLFELPDF
jgi:hypothetical protein